LLARFLGAVRTWTSADGLQRRDQFAVPYDALQTAV
jgi:hypothetical protein